ncbi:tRNA lysidine(34) synthetase TilS [Dyadobacter sp. 676]|uniref:tRNA(Ile)-lysidine synthetase n=1 Tax=Dyadobacter sp. 676 TaxID=3088362 RepID=A0AAU8FQ91_9BACT
MKALVKSASISTQMAARELRYEWFEKIRTELGFQWIATAHHANDSLETLLLNLARGTGLPGICGIAPVHGRLIRPLILSSKEAVQRYAAVQGLDWREDRTNRTDDYRRNKIRHHVIPVLSQLNPSLEATFNTSSERLRAANTLLDEYLQEWKSRAIQFDDDVLRIPVREVAGKTEPVYRLWIILQDFGFQYNQMGGIVAALAGIPGKRFFSSSHVLLLDRDFLLLQAIRGPSGPEELTIGEPESTLHWQGIRITLRKLPAGILPVFDNATIAVDQDLLTFPLTLRKWRQGDSFQPLGMAGKSKKSERFTDRS